MASTSSAPEVWSLIIIYFFRSDAEIAEGISEDEFKKLINVDTNWVKLVRTVLEYQGFDPRVILSLMLRNSKSYIAQKNRVEWDLKKFGDDLKVHAATEDVNKFFNEESLSKDVNFMITVFLARNNHINKIIKKARGVEDILNMLKEKYNIDDEEHKSGPSLDSRTITLPRVAGVFPGTAVRTFHDKAVKEIVSYDLPVSNPSVCPSSLNTDNSSNFHPVMIWAALKLDEIIHRKDKDLTSLIDLLGYYRAGFQSAAVPEKARVTIFKHIGLITLEHRFLTWG